MNSVVQRLRDIFHLERSSPVSTLPESNHSGENDSGVTESYNMFSDFIHEVQALVIEAAMECGVSIDQQKLDARRLAEEEHGINEYEDTPQMFFEDVLLALELTRLKRFDGLAVQVEALEAATEIFDHSLTFLRDVYQIGVGKGNLDKEDPLKKFVEADLMVWEKLQELEKKLELVKKSPGGVGFG